MACDTCAALAPSRWKVAWLPSISTIEILTVIVQVAVFSPAVAVMVAVPSPMAVTIPSCDTVATASSEDVHEASPAPSGRTVAVSCMVSPLLVKVAVAGDISTDCTSWVTVTSHVPLFPLTVAVTVAVPLLIPVTVPSDDTVAIASSDEVHVISPAVAFSGDIWAVSYFVSPHSRLMLSGETLTPVTVIVTGSSTGSLSSLEQAGNIHVSKHNKYKNLTFMIWIV